ncbi:MAG: hypothetical protein ACREQ5_38750, partial [Candidatus Dormibacteria bacterium]
MRARRGTLAALPLAGLGLWGLTLASAQQASGTVPASALQACAAIGAAGERLACFDRLAGRTSG